MIIHNALLGLHALAKKGMKIVRFKISVFFLLTCLITTHSVFASHASEKYQNTTLPEYFRKSEYSWSNCCFFYAKALGWQGTYRDFLTDRQIQFSDNRPKLMREYLSNINSRGLMTELRVLKPTDVKSLNCPAIFLMERSIGADYFVFFSTYRR